MRRQIEGSRAIAEAVALCHPQVVPAYPITPQTHIVEAIGAAVKSGELTGCEFITVESEFAAMSAALGASAAGARAYTATASQGLLYMAEVLYNVSGMGFPVVLTVANRAIGAPINIWNDQSDSMSQRDCGWVQLYAPDNQAATDLHVVAFKLAEQLSVPVMVCVDGFVLTHAVEPIDVPSAEQVDAFLPPYVPRQILDPAAPVTMGAMVGPDAFTEVRALAHQQLLRAVPTYAALRTEYAAVGREVPAAVATHCVDGADIVLLTTGSVTGTASDLADALADTQPFGVISLTMYRPFPVEELRRAVRGARHVVVLDRALSPGAGGPVATDVKAALAGLPIRVSTVVAGLGGRVVTSTALRGVVEAAAQDTLPEFSFLDAHTEVIDHELAEVNS